MNFYSTNDPSHVVSLRDAVLNGLAPDGGLYMPCEIPAIEWDASADFHELAFRLARPFLRDELSDADIRTLVVDTLAFDVPLVRIDDRVSVLELFHGPTCAFKDFGARFMARLAGRFAADLSSEAVAKGEDGTTFTVLVATSGDTGSAVAAGFLNVPGIRVVILYPSGKVSDIQERQLTTMGGNVTALEIDGVFDDCQRLVKQAFVDPDLSSMNLMSANSINIARLIPQMFYYASAAKDFPWTSVPLVSVPSGNLGNITAGLIAKRMGVPIGRFIAATNENDVVPEYLDTAIFRPRPSVATISNAMDVGNPSNFARIVALYGGDVEAIRRDVVGVRVTDGETREAMHELFASTGYVADPHGAVAYAGLRCVLGGDERARGIFLETAHPAKFGEVVRDAIGVDVDVPERLAGYLGREKVSVRMGKGYGEFKKWLTA